MSEWVWFCCQPRWTYISSLWLNRLQALCSTLPCKWPTLGFCAIVLHWISVLNAQKTYKAAHTHTCYSKFGKSCILPGGNCLVKKPVNFTCGLALGLLVDKLVHISSTECELAQLCERVESVQHSVSQTAWRASADRMEFIPYVPGIPRMCGTQTWPTERTAESAMERGEREQKMVCMWEREGGRDEPVERNSLFPKEIFWLSVSGGDELRLCKYKQLKSQFCAALCVTFDCDIASCCQISCTS